MDSCQSPPLTESLSSPYPSAAMTESPQSRLQRMKTYIRKLHKKMQHIRRLEIYLSKGISLDINQQKLLNSKLDVLYRLNMVKLFLKTDREISSMNERYLCISNGFVILCLDLNHSLKKKDLKECSFELEPLPKISTLVLPDLGFPVSMGMFKLGLDAYLIGGHMVPCSFEASDLWCDLAKCFYGQDKFEWKSSLLTYGLSLVKGNLSISKTQTIKPLKKPKFWPMVEEVGGQIHVMESFPQIWNYPRPPIVPSHEVLDGHKVDHGWTRLSCPTRLSCLPHCGEQLEQYSWHSLAVGDRIYLKRCLYLFEVFDTTTQKREWHRYPNYKCIPHLYSINHVAELIIYGYGRCIGELRHAGSSYGPLYVVIGVGEDENAHCSAAAYLVTPMGQILCYQRLPFLFGKFARVFEKSGNGTVICVDGRRQTYCAIVPGCTQYPTQQFIFISIFTVEDSLFVSKPFPPSILSREVGECDLYLLPKAVEKPFVNLFVKDWHAYEFEYHDMGRWYPRRLSACFLVDR